MARGRRRRARALIQGVVDDVNAQHSRFEQIKRFAILSRDFSADEGEVTPTLKLRRRVVQEHFAEEIEQLYGGLEAAGADVSRRVPAVVQARDLDHVARVR